MTSRRTKKFNSVLSAGKIKVTVCWDNKRCYSWQLLAKWTIVNTYAETLKNPNIRHHQEHTQETFLKCCSSMTTLSCTQVGTPQRPSSEILNGQCCHPPYNPDLAHQITTYFVLWKKACQDTITPMMWHCIMPHASGCTGGTVAFTRQENTLLFKGGRRMLPKMETMLKNNYVFSNFVAKFCEIFTLSNLWNKKQKALLSTPCIKKIFVRPSHVTANFS